MTFDLTPDSIAQELLRRARLDLGEIVPLEAIAHRLGLTLVQSPSRCLHGASIAGTIAYDGTQRTLAHELAHHACALAQLPRPHDEHLVAAIGARLVVPTAVFRRALRTTSRRADLARVFGVNETCSALRFGEVTGEPIAVITPRVVLVRGEWEWPAADVLRRMIAQRSRLIRVEALRDNRRRIVVTPRASESPR